MEVKRVPKIFISYRRDDAVESASHLHDTLTSHFRARHIFWDVSDIEGGAIFDETIKSAVNSSKTLLAVIGRDWLTITNGGKRRLDDENDYVRLEIATALRQGIPVIPVLVEGASLPRAQDLPDDLKKLVQHQYIKLSAENWKEDAKKLVKIVEKAFKRNYPYSLFGGAIGGLIAGVTVGVLYVAEGNVEWPGIIEIGLYGLFVGAVLSGCINSGIAWCAKLLNKSPSSKIIGGTFGGALGGILATIVGGLWFLAREREAVSYEHVMWGVAVSAIFITLGILLPDLQEGWNQTAVTIIILVCVVVVTIAITTRVLTEPNDWVPALKVGLACGTMSGVQVGSALFVYDRYKVKLERANP